MNLQDTIKQMTGKDLNEDEAKQFAIDQFGVLAAHIRSRPRKPTYEELTDCLRSCHAYIMLNRPRLELPQCAIQANELLLKLKP